MTIERDIDPSARRELDRQESAETLLVFLTIRHANLPEDVRVVSDPVDYVLDGNTFQGFMFDIQLLSDTDAPPTTRLTLQNVDERIGDAILSVPTRARLDFEVIAASQFDLTQNPRVPLATPVQRIYAARHLALTDVDGDVLQLSGTIRSYDYTQEAWPAMRATQLGFPGLYL
ncbi:DUF1833 family protein [Stappia sp. F7233]|uniref:DUF1833 family protein n=1 Tax=Stappia albiluteola TaxID=2758565 RepID=A0A839AC92_9HYPH|nr:DUF1833 family protein [Stappia albiluteola]MBA5776299.1 DUF1833 family protein [Stappia albiluteola]MBA5776310.1 DUF1833 family protein [Stappia albiluteola]